MENTKETDIKQHQKCYFFDDMINIKDLDPNLLKMGKKSLKTSAFIILDISL